jgi:hypothetical protein
MLAQLLTRDFMLKSMRTLNRGMIVQAQEYAQADPEVTKLMAHAEVNAEDLRVARDEFDAAIKRETSRNTDELVDSAFFPRDAVISLAQSALQEFCEAEPNRIVRNAARHAGAAQHIPVTDSEIDPSLASFLVSDSPKQGFAGKYEAMDIRWANCLAAIGVRRWRTRHVFNDKPAQPFYIGNRARVVVLSDWGSGLPRARRVSEAIRETLDEPAATNRDKHVVHLGDVYYSGLASEFENNFLADWPVKRKEADVISSWALNANHDMYSGGWGYFDRLLGNDPRFKRQHDVDGNSSSFFSLENDHWLILGLDTGYHENLIFDAHDLYGSQSQWVNERLGATPNKNGILLSHHQPFSFFEKGGEKLLEKLEGPLTNGRVRAWFWGHEHRCTLYEPRENIEYPRCVGYGGIPFHVSKSDPPAGVIYDYHEGFQDLLESWNYFGFVVLDFDDDRIHVSYINEQGTKHHEEVITKK